MSIDNAFIADLPDFSDAELLKLYRYGLTNGVAGQTRTINGRSVSFPALPDMIKAIAWLEQRIQDASDASSGMSGGCSVVTFDDPT